MVGFFTSRPRAKEDLGFFQKPIMDALEIEMQDSWGFNGNTNTIEPSRTVPTRHVV
jgi:hypothetical protein